MTDSKVSKKPSERDIREQTFYSVSVDELKYEILLPDAATDYIQKKIAAEGRPYELEMLQDIRGRLSAQDLVLDVGANIGNHTLFLAAVAGCKVIAFEPNRHLSESLKKSVQRNKLSQKVTIHAVALGKAHGKGRFAEELPENLGGQRVEIGSGDISIDFLDHFTFDAPVKVIKVDVEGMELDVLEGGKALLIKDRPLLYIECQHERDFRVVANFLDGLGYRYWDTFNATPTHLFLPAEQVDVADHLARLHFKTIEETYRTSQQLTDLRNRLDSANKKYREVNERYAELKERLLTEQSKSKAAAGKLGELERQVIQARKVLEAEQARWEKQLGELQTDLQARTATANEMQKAFHEAQKNLIRSESALESVREKLDDANRKYKESTERYAHLKDRLQNEEALRGALAEEVARLKGEREQANRQRQDERARWGEELKAVNAKYRESTERYAQLKERLGEEEALRKSLTDELASAKADLERANRRYDAERAAWQQQLDDANLKYREANERYDIIKERLHTAEQRHESVAGKLAELTEEFDEKTRQFERDVADLRRETFESRQEKIAEISEADVAHAAWRSAADALTNTVQAGLAEKRAELADAILQIRRLEHQKRLADSRAAKARESVSYRLGNTLIQGFGSFSGFFRLPGSLLKLRKERRAERLNRQKHVEPKEFVTSQPGLLFNRALQGQRKTAQAIEPRALKATKVAAIMDEFTRASYAPECNLLQLTPEHWRRELEAFRPDILFVESAWRGKHDLWGSKVGHRSKELIGIVEWCQRREIPTVFWNKEDPVHFETFLSTAKLFDFVFTTDFDCIHRYKRALEHDRVYLLPFACQPEFNNPIETFKRKDAFCFAGAYYVRYPERTRDLDDFLATLPEFKPVEVFDRNFGKNDPNYQFPPQYEPYIVGNLPFSEIEKAYKGYNYAINLNSIKNSQSMFARRVFELLASNTVTISNYSRGLRLLFGDLVFTADDGAEIRRRLSELESNNLRRIKLLALRKVMQEHTYQHRFAYVMSKVKEQPSDIRQPTVLVTGYVRSQKDLDALIASFERQNYRNRYLLVGIRDGFIPSDFPKKANIIPVSASYFNDPVLLQQVSERFDWIGGMVPEDYYGVNYLTDLMAATAYARASMVGKAARYSWSKRLGFQLESPAAAYKPAKRLAARSALVKAEHLPIIVADMGEWFARLYRLEIQLDAGLAIDEYNYCRNNDGSEIPKANIDELIDLKHVDIGIELATLLRMAENLEPEAAPSTDARIIRGGELAGLFNLAATKGFKSEIKESDWEVASSLADGKHEYLYASRDLEPEELGFSEHRGSFYFETTPGLNIQLVMLFLDKDGERVGHQMISANRNTDVGLPSETNTIRPGLRVYGSGFSAIRGVVLGYRPFVSPQIIGNAEYLLLTNHYPSYDNLYRNGFVHSRVAAYREAGLNVDVFRLRDQESVSYHEFKGVDVVTGPAQAIETMLESGRYKAVLVHFLDELMWTVLAKFIDRVEVTVWVHGAEIQPWWRREYNYHTEEELSRGKEQSERRLKFWRGLLQPMPKRLRLVFVSAYFANEVTEDLGFQIPSDQYTIIHNPIDTKLFNYVPKDVTQRNRILSIRPFASPKYANDLSMRTIELLSKEPWFKDLVVRVIGDGPLFEDTTAAVRRFENVTLERRFLSQHEIAELHKQYGIFLCPTRMDAQGVSRDEAMASGLVPVTNGVAAIPEFVDESCGVIAPAEDASGMAKGIIALYQQPELFRRMSAAAAERVRRQSSATKIILREVEYLRER